jgi:hypothetical protein
MVGVEWNCREAVSLVEKQRFWQPSNNITDGLSLSPSGSGKLKLNIRKLRSIQPHDEKSLPHLRDAKIIGIQLRLKNPETGTCEEPLEEPELLAMPFVLQAKDILEDKKIEIECIVKLAKN